ncbi:Indole-3-glycerol phosphate synthase [compost metagenome]
MREAVLGVNNRNLHNFETRLETSVQLRELAPPTRRLVAESGIRNREDVRFLQSAGIDAFLVGEAFMREAEPGAALRRLFFDVAEQG